MMCDNNSNLNNINGSVINNDSKANFTKLSISRSLNNTPIHVPLGFRESFLEKDKTSKRNTLEIYHNKYFNLENASPPISLPDNFTVSFIGQKFVGKSSIINRMLNKCFKKEYDESIVDSYSCEKYYDLDLNMQNPQKDKDEKLNKLKKNQNYGLNFSLEIEEENEDQKNPNNNLIGKETHIFKIIDTGDFDTYFKDIEEYIRMSNCIIFVYAIDNIKSFKKITEIFLKVKEMKLEIKNMILVGNKIDLNLKRNVPFFEAVVFAEQNNLKFLEASAKDCFNIHKIFQMFVDTEINRNNKNEFIDEDKKDEFCICKCF